jgi:hypothetical protein
MFYLFHAIDFISLQTIQQMDCIKHNIFWLDREKQDMVSIDGMTDLL